MRTGWSGKSCNGWRGDNGGRADGETGGRGRPAGGVPSVRRSARPPVRPRLDSNRGGPSRSRPSRRILRCFGRRGSGTGGGETTVAQLGQERDRHRGQPVGASRPGEPGGGGHRTPGRNRLPGDRDPRRRHARARNPRRIHFLAVRGQPGAGAHRQRRRSRRVHSACLGLHASHASPAPRRRGCRIARQSHGPGRQPRADGNHAQAVRPPLGDPRDGPVVRRPRRRDRAAHRAAAPGPRGAQASGDFYLEHARGDRARGRGGSGHGARHDPATGPRDRYLRVGGLTDRAAQFRRGADRARGGGTGARQLVHHAARLRGLAGPGRPRAGRRAAGRHHQRRQRRIRIHAVRRGGRADRLAAALLPFPRRGDRPEGRGEPRRHDPGRGRNLVKPRALLSVSDKRGIVELARELVALGWEIVSTGGTAEAMRAAGVPVIPIEQVTGFPEMMDGRMKTLHPKVHGGLLARRAHPGDRAALAEHGITPIDLVAVNLYPFRETVAKPGVTFEQAIEQIDIGGPSMLRSAAKNHQDVIVVVDPDDYPVVIASLRDMARGVSPGLRKDLAAKVFAHTAAYDAAIHGYLTKDAPGWPERITLALERRQELRYGENPHQAAALYAAAEPGIRDLHQLHGKELSFNNLLDLDAGLLAVAPWSGRGVDRAACAIIKHTTPCGIALGRSPREAYERALATDRTSAFGSVIAYNVSVDRAAAEAMRDLFVEVVVAPAFAEDAVRVFQEKKNLRLVRLPVGESMGWDWKRIRGGFLAQERSRLAQVMDETRWKVMTKREPTDVEWRDLRFAWGAVGAVKSNAILLARDEAAIGIGAGQTSRVDASFLAIHKARQQGHDPKGAVLASDAFFPFPDGVEEAAHAGVGAIIQPGGSVKDAEVVAAADQAGLAMVFTGIRQFRH